MRIFFLILLLGFSFLIKLKGQTKPIIFPELMDNASTTLHLRCYCKPGIQNKSKTRGAEVAFNFIPSTSLRGTKNTAINSPSSELRRLTEIILKIKIPIINKPGLKFIIGYQHQQEQYHFRRFGTDFKPLFESLDGQSLKINSFTAYLTKSINEKWYTGLRYQYSLNGNYNGGINFNGEYSTHSIIGALGYKKSDDFEMGIGLSYSRTIDARDRIIPFLIFNMNLNEKWGIETILPASIFLRNNFNDKNLFLIGIDYGSQTYSVDLEDRPNNERIRFALDHSELKALISWERKLVPWIWTNLKVGYQFNFSTQFLGLSSNATTFDVDPNNVPFFRISIFVSPPSELIK